MGPLIPIISALATVYNERIKTKSTIDGAAITAAAAGIVSSPEVVGLPPDSVESYVVSIVVALVGLYRIFKKDAVK